MLTNNQRPKVRELATIAHEHRMRVVGLLRVKDEAVRFKQSLMRSLKETESLLAQHEGYFRQLEDAYKRGRVSEKDYNIHAAPYLSAKARFVDLESQIAEARADLDRLGARISEENDIAAPAAQLLDRILRHARVNRSDLGIDFAESEAGIASVEYSNAIPAREMPRRTGSVA